MQGHAARGRKAGPAHELMQCHTMARVLTYGMSPAVVEAVAEEYNVDDGEPLLWDVGLDSAAPTGLHCWSSPAVGKAYYSKDLM